MRFPLHVKVPLLYLFCQKNKVGTRTVSSVGVAGGLPFLSCLTGAVSPPGVVARRVSSGCSVSSGLDVSIGAAGSFSSPIRSSISYRTSHSSKRMQTVTHSFVYVVLYDIVARVQANA